MTERISFVIPKHLKKSLKELRALTGEDQSTLLRKLVGKGLADARMDIAIDQYVKERHLWNNQLRSLESRFGDFLTSSEREMWC